MPMPSGSRLIMNFELCTSVTSAASVRRENTVAYSADEGQIICRVFSETAQVQRSSTPAIRLVGHFPADSARMRIICTSEGSAL